MSVLKNNIVANFAGNMWQAFMGLAFIPLYIKFMGVESYGLVGVFATLLTIFGLLDMGLSTSLNREMARLAVQNGKAREMRDLVRTLEIPYWLAGVIISILIIFSSRFIAYQWVNVKNLSPKTVQTAIMIMGLVVAFQWPIGFYSGGLMGLQRQFLLSVINSVMATFRGLGAVLILWLVSPTIEAFFLWQIIASIVHISSIVFFLWRNLPYSAETPRFRGELIRNIWRFAAGMAVTTVTGLFLTQIDKIILSKMLTLEDFGYYTFGAVVAATVYRVTGPIYSAVFPRFSELVSLRDEIGLRQVYHKSCQFLAVMILPPSIMLAFFTSEILLLWTGDPITVARSYPIVRLLVISAVLNGLTTIPYALTLAYGWTRITVYTHCVAIVVLGPLIYSLTTTYGVVGAPIGWVVFNGCNVFLGIHIIHSRLLKGEKWKWYLHDLIKPSAAALIVASILRVSISVDGISRTSMFLLMLGALLVTFTATVFATPYTRSWIIQVLKKNIMFSKLKIMFAGKPCA